MKTNEITLISLTDEQLNYLKKYKETRDITIAVDLALSLIEMLDI